MNETMKYAIVVKDVSFDYGKRWKRSLVLNSLNINVPKGKIYGLLGPSGCGKTTLLKLITGLREPNNGNISVFGYKPGSIESGTPGIGVGYMPQEISLPTLLTVNEVFQYFGNLYLLENQTIDAKMKYFLRTLNLSDEKAFIRNLSGGEKRRVSLAIALFSSPRLLILDEPTVGVDPMLRQTIWSYLKRLTQESKTTIIVTTHYVEEMKCAETVAFMRKGEILEETEPKIAIEKHGCFNLESVFLKLCQTQKLCGRNPTNMATSLRDFEGECNDNDHSTVVESIERKKNRLRNEMICIKAVILKSFYDYWRVKGSIIAYIIPLVCISLCIVCIGKNPKDVPIGWVIEKLSMNHSSTADVNGSLYLPELLLKNINKKLIHIIKYETVEAAVEDAKKMKIMGYVHLKQNFSENFYERDLLIIDESDYISNVTIDSGTIHLYLDSTNLILQRIIVREIFETVLKFREEAFMKIGISKSVSSYPIKIGEPIYGTIATEEFTQYTHNAVICFTVLISFILSMTVAANSVAIDINSDVYSRSISAGLKPHQLIIGETISRFLFMLSVSALSLIALLYVFNVTLKGSLLLAIMNLVSTILCGLGLGALFAVIIQSLHFCHIFVTAVSIAITILSGAVWPLEALPNFVKYFVSFIPCTLPVFAMLKIFNYSHIDFVSHILPAFVSSSAYYLASSILTCYFLKKLVL